MRPAENPEAGIAALPEERLGFGDELSEQWLTGCLEPKLFPEVQEVPVLNARKQVVASRFRQRHGEPGFCSGNPWAFLPINGHIETTS